MSHKPIILAAVDLQVGSALVFRRAVAMAAAMEGAELHLLSVGAPYVPSASYAEFAPSIPPSWRDPKEVADFARRELDEMRAQNAFVRLPPVVAHAAVGVPADEIVWLAANLDAEAVVIGSHGRRGLARLLLGSVAEKVVRLAGCPVVVVREKAHNPQWKVPEIEPLCPSCAEVRAASGGAELWCQRHKESHVRAHVYGYSFEGEDRPSAWSAATGQ